MKYQNLPLRKVAALIPKPLKTRHKKSFGQLLIVAGSKKYPGSLGLCSQAASKIGAGFISICPDAQDLLPALDLVPSGPLTAKRLTDFKVIAMGPGLTSERKFKSHLRLILKAFQGFVVLDASALRWIAQSKKNIQLNRNFILTPHEGEMASLIKKTSRWVKENRREAVQLAAQKYQCLVLLKGPETLISNGEKIYCVKNGNSALAKAGTGDILTGLISGFALQMPDLYLASILAATFLGFIADQWSQNKNDVLSLTPTDILQQIPEKLLKLRKI